MDFMVGLSSEVDVELDKEVNVSWKAQVNSLEKIEKEVRICCESKWVREWEEAVRYFNREYRVMEVKMAVRSIKEVVKQHMDLDYQMSEKRGEVCTKVSKDADVEAEVPAPPGKQIQRTHFQGS